MYVRVCVSLHGILAVVTLPAMCINHNDNGTAHFNLTMHTCGNYICTAHACENRDLPIRISIGN